MNNSILPSDRLCCTRLFVSLCAVLQLVALSPSAAAEYVLENGDVIELSVAGAPELRQRSTVDVNGQVTFPLIGNLKAAGLSIDVLSVNVRRLIEGRVLRRSTPDGRDTPTFVMPELVSLTVSEYRPIYITGDIAKPGELSFRPGLTVRKAVALAGGYDLMRGRTIDPFLEHATLRSEYDALWIELTKEQIRLKRIESELIDQQTIDNPEIFNSPVKATLKEDIESLEARHLVARTRSVQKRKRNFRGRNKTDRSANHVSD